MRRALFLASVLFTLSAVVCEAESSAAGETHDWLKGKWDAGNKILLRRK